MKLLKPLGLLLAAGLAATVVACDPGTGTGAGDTPEGDVAPAETDPATEPETDPEAPEGTEGGQG
jgi:hypothetical protein